MECRTLKRNDNSKYVACYGPGSNQAKKDNKSTKNISKKVNKSMPKKAPARDDKKDRALISKAIKDNARISYQQSNPKQEGSKANENYNNYKSAKTMKSAMEKGSTRRSFLFDYQRGYLRIQKGPGAQEESKPPAQLVKLSKQNVRASTPRKLRLSRPKTPTRARTPRRMAEGKPYKKK